MDTKDRRQKEFLVEFYGGYIWKLTREQYEKVLQDTLLDEKVLQDTLLDGKFPDSPLDVVGEDDNLVVRGFEHPADYSPGEIRRLLKDLKAQDREAEAGKEISDFVSCRTVKDDPFENG